jgi:AraC-like DNA-binding protein
MEAPARARRLPLSGRLDDPPSLAELASAAAVSPFHFHRIWRALTRETVGQTILRLRMEVSQELLLVKDAGVTETATAIGFGTPQSTGATTSRRRKKPASPMPELPNPYRHRAPTSPHRDLTSRRGLTNTTLKISKPLKRPSLPPHRLSQWVPTFVGTLMR